MNIHLNIAKDVFCRRKMSLRALSFVFPTHTRSFTSFTVSNSKGFGVGFLSSSEDAVFVPYRSFQKQTEEINKRIVWLKPEKVHPCRPEITGDLGGVPAMNLEQPPSEFMELEEFDKASDLVKRIVSLKFQPRWERQRSMLAHAAEKVKRHKYDVLSSEVRIAKITVTIRRIQKHLEVHPKDSGARVDAKELAEYRSKWLTKLRAKDYKRFEWLLECMDILYKPRPPTLPRIERKASIKKLALEYARNVEQAKLKSYKEALDARKGDFYKKKLATMKSIVADELEFGIEPSFSEEEIQELQKVVDTFEEQLQQKLLVQEASQKAEF